ncbi:conserved hypothetical protein [Microsporum canis CBS 113480]|uniref:NodB homology domain-containing protein n=1 Tax=Arthroderma otae (strain ATCC MYA-4605 / CBS 113480) TaxID=554155 RepID=C5FZ83_ARTOC|nr:conserved hypothetical protein [Microsporum canis CBS 113480]EEQ35186.1 conserved hypothetical protein [Microsporum canis CBS 113480]
MSRSYGFRRIVLIVVASILLLNAGTSLAAPVTKYDPLVIDTFRSPATNDLGIWHGADEGMPAEYGEGFLRLRPTNADMNFYTQLSISCNNMTGYKDAYLHVVFKGTDKFSISFTQHNAACDQKRAPYPETWDSVEASRYANGEDIYVPLSHFNIDFTRANSIGFHGFYTREEVTLFKVEIISAPPGAVNTPQKLPTGTLVLKCKRPNSFAFGIDDGQPQYAQEVMKILAEEDILVTFFTVGNGLLDESANFTNVYKEMLGRGHQVALHTFSHPILALLKNLRLTSVKDGRITNYRGHRPGIREEHGNANMVLNLGRYFRPPFGNVGARTRQRLAALVTDPYIVNWSVDIEDWLWAGSPTPEKQFEAFKRDFEKGGDIAVMHYLNPTTISYFRDVFQLVKKSGKRIMRVDQCMEDPSAPPLH